MKGEEQEKDEIFQQKSHFFKRKNNETKTVKVWIKIK